MPDPFISVQDVIDYVGRGDAADPGILIAVDAACDTVRTVAERDFNAASGTITLDGMGTDALPLPNRYLPVNAAGTVTVGGTVEADCMLTSNGVLLRGTAGCYPRPTWPQGRQNVEVTVDYGYADNDLPRDVRMVALSLASRLVVQGVATEETLGENRIKYAGAAMDLTNGERRILQKYRGIR